MRSLRTVVLTLALVGLTVGPVVATTGVSIDVSRIDVTEELAPGGQYELPRFGVRNPGTEPTSYAMVVTYVDGQEAHQPPAAWFSFSPANVTLDAGQSLPVSTSIEVPPDAEPGTYEALIGPQIAAAGVGPRVGAGAAARLSFTVGECEGFECWLRWLFRWIGEHLYVLLVPLAIAALIALRIVRRRFSFTVQRRPVSVGRSRRPSDGRMHDESVLDGLFRPFVRHGLADRGGNRPNRRPFGQRLARHGPQPATG